MSKEDDLPSWRFLDLESGRSTEIQHDPVLPSNMISGSRPHRFRDAEVSAPLLQQPTEQVDAHVTEPAPTPSDPVLSTTVPILEDAAPSTDHAKRFSANLGVFWRNSCTTVVLFACYLFRFSIIFFLIAGVYGLDRLLTEVRHHFSFLALIELVGGSLLALIYGLFPLIWAMGGRWIGKFEAFI